jgi:hypothetical protein
MGAWGVRIFESDSARDWAADLCAVGGVAKAVRNLVGPDTHEIIRYEDRGEEILIAVELLIAIRLGRPLPAFSPELATWWFVVSPSSSRYAANREVTLLCGPTSKVS